MRSDRTKQCARRYVIYSILSFLLLLFPFGYYTITGFITTGLIQKASLGVMFIMSGFMCLFCLIKKHKPRSIIWLLVIGLYIALENIMPLIIMVAIVSLLDEFIFAPQAQKYKRLTEENTEMDRRF